MSAGAPEDYHDRHFRLRHMLADLRFAADGLEPVQTSAGCVGRAHECSMNEDDGAVTVYWRPGCGFCFALLRGLTRAGLSFDQVDVWEDEDAAAFVRSCAGGNETVPTVRIGSVVLVNPSTPDVLRMVAAETPDSLPPGYEPVQPGLLARTVTKLLGR